MTKIRRGHTLLRVVRRTEKSYHELVSALTVGLEFIIW